MKRIALTLSAMLFVAITLWGCRGPMIITSDLMLGLMADSGSGTLADPYIIDGKDKTIYMAGRDSNAGIQLQYTSKPVILRNITVLDGVKGLNNLNESDRANKLGIFLQKVSNATIENCYIENNNMGMWLEGCSAVTVKDCTVVNNRYRGIYLMDSSNCNILGNTVSSDSPEYGDNILLNTNYKKPGSVCEYNHVMDNETEDIRLQGAKTNYNIIRDNTWGGLPFTVTVGPEVGDDNDID
jgi:parallel beta-helix repeat protein